VAIEVPRALVEFILLGPEDDRRQLQDSPILGDVWVAFAKNPGARLDLLISPHREHSAGTVASELVQCRIKDAHVAYLQGIVAAKLTFDEVLHYIIPMTTWWTEKRIAGGIESYIKAPGTMVGDIEAILEAAHNWISGKPGSAMRDLETRKRYIALAGLILWAQRQKATARSKRASPAS